MARAGIAEFPPDTLEETVALAGDLAGVGDRSLAAQNRRGQELEEVVAAGDGRRA